MNANRRSGALWKARHPVIDDSRIHPPPPPPPRKLLPVSIPSQAQSNWCWVAVGCGISTFYDNTTYSQCQIVDVVGNVLYGYNANCCQGSNGAGPQCNFQSGTDQALDHAGGHWAGTNFDRALSWDEVKDQIDQGRPIGAEVAFPGSTATHEVAITGYTYAGDPAVPIIYIQDPASGPSWYMLHRFTTRYLGDGTWVKTFLSQP